SLPDLIYIDTCAAPARYSTIGILDRERPRSKPAIATARLAHTQILLERPACRYTLCPAIAVDRQIIGMNNSRPATPPGLLLRDPRIIEEALVDKLNASIRPEHIQKCRHSIYHTDRRVRDQSGVERDRCLKVWNCWPEIRSLRGADKT